MHDKIERNSRRATMAAGASAVAIAMWVLLRPPHNGSGEGMLLLGAVLLAVSLAVGGCCGWLAGRIMRTINGLQDKIDNLQNHITAIEVERVRRDHRRANGLEVLAELGERQSSLLREVAAKVAQLHELAGAEGGDWDAALQKIGGQLNALKAKFVELERDLASPESPAVADLDAARNLRSIQRRLDQQD